jgi:hypothetical protein
MFLRFGVVEICRGLVRIVCFKLAAAALCKRRFLQAERVSKMFCFAVCLSWWYQSTKFWGWNVFMCWNHQPVMMSESVGHPSSRGSSHDCSGWVAKAVVTTVPTCTWNVSLGPSRVSLHSMIVRGSWFQSGWLESQTGYTNAQHRIFSFWVR